MRNEAVNSLIPKSELRIPIEISYTLTPNSELRIPNSRGFSHV